MVFELSFSKSHVYSEVDGPIFLPVTLNVAGESTTVQAVVDSGGAVCLFGLEVAITLGLDVESGIPKRLNSLGGPIDSFGHEVTLETVGLSFQSVVYFAKYPGLARNILGRQGWLRNLKLGLVDYENTMYLGEYQ
ncbi:MAG: hypothetical protein ACRD82_14330 [Blastocatellia bacterium]